MHIATAARRILVFSSICVVIVTCALMLFARNGTSSLCSASKKCLSSLVLSDDSAEIAAAKASMELEASVRHQKLQKSLDNAEARGDAIASHIRSEAASFLARMRSEANTTIRDFSAYSSAASHHTYFALLSACFLFIFR